MDKLLTLEPSKEVLICIEPGQKCSGHVTLKNLMHTMPVAFRVQPTNPSQYKIQPCIGIISPLATLTLEITYLHPSCLPKSLPYSKDSFLLNSMVVPGAKSSSPSVIESWFSIKKNQVFTDTTMTVFFAGSVVLSKLAAHSSLDHVREVLKRAFDPSLLYTAISTSRADLARLVLEFGPDLGPAALESAAAAGESQIVGLLLAHGASAASWGPLYYAAVGGSLEVARQLLAKGGARADLCGGPNGDTALHAAAFSGDERMVRLMVSRGGAGLKEVRNFRGKTAYDTAAENGHVKLYEMLKLGDRLADCARKGEVKNAVRLIEGGAGVNGRDQNGWTALMRAGFKNRVEMMKALMEKGADVNARDGEGYSALHCAAEAGNVEAVELLVKRGADVEGRTKKGASAMVIAGSLGYVGIERVLSQAGARREKCGAGKSEELVGGLRRMGRTEGKKKGSRLRTGSVGPDYSVIPVKF